MKSKYLDSAMLQVPDRELLINLVSKRVRQLTQGHRPLVQTDPKMNYADITLKEITEGKIGYEIPSDAEVLEAEAKRG
jgi:DNA-directed RNA polymerase subunit omega